MLHWVWSHEALRVWRSTCRGWESALSRRWKNQSKPTIRLPGRRRRILMEGRSQRILVANPGTKLLARRVQERSFTTTLFREPISLSAQKNGLCTEASLSYTATKVTCKDSSSTVDSVQGSVTGYKDVSTVGERAPMSAVARQPVSAAIQADQSSFQS